MTERRLIDLDDRVSVRAFSINLTSVRYQQTPTELEQRYGRGHSLRIALSVTDRDHGLPVLIAQEELFHELDSRPLEVRLLNLLMQLVAHEMQESVYVDGKLFRDPHA